MPPFRRIPGLGQQGRAAARRDVDAEIGAHIEETVASLVAQGWTEPAAREEAMRRFGDVTGTRSAMTQSVLRQQGRARRRDWLDGWRTDLRYAARLLRRSPALAATIMLTLSLGIGASTAMFAFLDRMLLRPPAGVRAPDELRRAYFRMRDGASTATITEVSLLRVNELRELAGDVIELAGLSEAPVIIGQAEAARDVRGAFVTGNFWSLAGMRPALGRLFDDTDDAGSLVLGHAWWQSQYGGDSTVIGRTLAAGARTFTIVGVAPADFTGIGSARVDAWMPATAITAVYTFLQPNWPTTHGFSWLSVVARLRPGVTESQAAQRLGLALRASLAQQGDTLRATDAAAQLWPLLQERGPERNDNTRVALWLGAVAAMVLLLACSNVANLLLARSVERRSEVGLRLALGISRSRLVRQLFLESGLLAAGGAILGVLLSRLAVRALSVFLAPDPAAVPVQVDGRILAFAALVAVVASLLSGFGPVAYAMGADVRSLLGGGREGRRPTRLRGGLLVGQTALSTVLLIVAGLFVRSLETARDTRLGFDAEQLLTARLRLRTTEEPPGGTRAVYRDLLDVVRAVPGVRSVTTTVQVPFSITSSTGVDVPGVDSAGRFGEFRLNAVGEDYFETMGTRIRMGRALTREDREGTPNVLVVSETMARLLWPGVSALGRCVKVGGPTYPCSEVVGVAEDVHQEGVRSETALQYWFPESQRQGDNSGIFALVIRTEGEARLLAPVVRQALGPRLPASVHLTVTPLASSVDRVVRPWRLGATMFSAFGALGLVIASVGLFSVLAYAVSQRQREFGVRVALGARQGGLVRMVLVQGLRLAAAGIVLGVAACVALGNQLAPLLLGVGPRDPLVLGGVVLALGASAVLAGALPAWRATRVSPSVALRAE